MKRRTTPTHSDLLSQYSQGEKAGCDTACPKTRNCNRAFQPSTFPIESPKLTIHCSGEKHRSDASSIKWANRSGYGFSSRLPTAIYGNISSYRWVVVAFTLLFMCDRLSCSADFRPAAANNSVTLLIDCF